MPDDDGSGLSSANNNFPGGHRMEMGVQKKEKAAFPWKWTWLTNGRNS